MNKGLFVFVFNEGQKIMKRIIINRKRSEIEINALLLIYKNNYKLTYFNLDSGCRCVL